MLSERRQRVLRALIEDYIEYALPVGSRTLTERHRLGVSPATVRNDLSALEDAGFIQQPHTSAGRVPTDAGYRTFVDELLSSGLAEEERPHQAMVDELRAEFGPDLNEGSIAVLPSPDETHPNILIKAKDCAQDAGYRELTW